MGEKRFIYGFGFPINSDDPIRIISDSVEGNDYYKFSDICNVLNEKQFTIEQLQDLCGKSDGENAKLRIENKRLQEENEQLRQILKDIVVATDETYTKSRSVYKVSVVFDNETYLKIRECLNE